MTAALFRSCVVAGCLLWLSSASAATLPSGFAETRVATGLASPTAMAIAPDGRIFVAEKGGTLRVARGGMAAAWATKTAKLDAWAGQTIQLRIDAADEAGGSLIEAGVDNVAIVAN